MNNDDERDLQEEACNQLLMHGDGECSCAKCESARVRLAGLAGSADTIGSMHRAHERDVPCAGECNHG
jgi:hypothetical protein